MSDAPSAAPRLLGACPPVSVSRSFVPADVGPHFNQSGELWWYLGALDRDDGGGLVCVQLSFFRKSSDNCTDASRNDVISTLAIGLPPDRFVQTTRITPAINVSRWRAEPYSLALGARWGVTAAASRSRQRLRAEGLDLGNSTWVSADLDLDVAAPYVRMGDGGIALLPSPGAPPSVLGHIAQPRIPASGTVRVGNASLAVRGEMWLQHIWWSAVPGGAFPTWNWFNLQLSDGFNLMLMALGNATDSTEASGCLGRVGSYGNLVDPRGASAALNWSDVCIRVRDVYEDAQCGVRYPVRSDIRVGAQLRLVVTAEVRDSVVRQGGCKTSYFEGASRATGEHGGRAVDGRGFTEHQWMTL